MALEMAAAMPDARRRRLLSVPSIAHRVIENGRGVSRVLI